MKRNPGKKWSKEQCAKSVTLPLTKEEYLSLGIPEKGLLSGEVRGELKTFGPWGIPVSYKALAEYKQFTPEESRRYAGESEGVEVYGERTLTNITQRGYELEGRVSVGGKKYRGFTSSQLFDVDGKLVSVATIFVCK